MNFDEGTKRADELCSAPLFLFNFWQRVAAFSVGSVLVVLHRKYPLASSAQKSFLQPGWEHPPAALPAPGAVRKLCPNCRPAQLVGPRLPSEVAFVLTL